MGCGDEEEVSVTEGWEGHCRKDTKPFVGDATADDMYSELHTQS